MELMITALLHKTDDSDWAQQDLSPLKDIQLLDATRRAVQSSAWTPLADGTKHLVDFKDVDGYKSR